MAVDHYGNIQTIAEIMQDNCRSAGIGTAVSAAHGAGFVHQQPYCKLRYLIGQSVLIEYLAIAPAQGVSVKPAAHNEAGLLTSLPVLFQFLLNTPLELLGYRQQPGRNSIVLLYEVSVNTGNAVDFDAHARMNIAVGNAICHLVQL